MRTFDYTKLAERSWDMDILTDLAKIYEYKGKQDLLVRQRPEKMDRLVEIAKIQSTESSNKIEGIVTTGTRMRQLFEEKTTPRNRDENEIMGYRDVLQTIHESYKVIPLRPNYILQLHRDLLKRAGLSYGGQFKNVQNNINETRADGTVVTLFTPVSPYETESALEAICTDFTKTRALEQVDPLLLISAFICDFLCIHPFNDGNGRMSRLLTLLLLYQSGFEVGKYISMEKKIEESKDAYYDALSRSNQGWHEAKNDPTPFIRYMLQVLLACYTDFEERIGMIAITDKNSSAYDVVKTFALRKLGKFTSAQVLAECPSVGRSSVLAALKRLTDEHLVIKMGRGRSTCYVRNDAAAESDVADKSQEKSK